MYKCTDCGQEYKEKPDYCDCGNNTFEEIIEQNAPQTQIEQNKEPLSLSENNDAKEKTLKVIHNETYVKDKASWAIFILCIILSIFSLIFIGKTSPATNSLTQEHQTTETAKTISKETKPLPSINELWDDTATQTPQETDTNEQELQNNEISQQPVQTIKAPARQIPQPVSSNNQKKTPDKTAVSKPAAPKQNTAQAKRELLNYKISLRNKIAQKINFGAIVGDGNCIITFKISKSGNLTGRSFSKLSENESLNDAVYSAMMQTPTFNPPPSAYKNETLRLSVKMYGGNFEVDLN